MPAHFQISLDLPDIEMTSVWDGEQDSLILEEKAARQPLPTVVTVPLRQE